jgi:hypothetical protein
MEAGLRLFFFKRMARRKVKKFSAGEIFCILPLFASRHATSRLVRSSQGRSCQVTSRASREGGPHGRLSRYTGFFVVTFLEFAFFENSIFPRAEEPAPPDKFDPSRNESFLSSEHDAIRGARHGMRLHCRTHHGRRFCGPGCGDSAVDRRFRAAGIYFELSISRLCAPVQRRAFQHSD